MMDRATAYAAIRERSLFRLLREDDAFEIAGLAKLIHVATGAHVPRGESADALFIVADGSIELHEKTGAGDVVSHVSKGRSLELGAFLRRADRWEHDWVAERETHLLRIPAEPMLAAIRATPGLERYLHRVIADVGIRRLKNDLRLFGYDEDEIIRVIGNMVPETWSTLKTSYATSPGLALVERGTLAVEIQHIRRKYPLGPFTPGDYLYLDEASGRVDGDDDTRLWFLPRELWQKESSADKIERFLGVADPITLKRTALREAAIPRTQTAASTRRKPADEEVDTLGVADFKVEPAALQKLHRKSRPVVRQHDEMDCGAACLATVAEFYGRKIGIPTYRSLVQVTRDGASLAGLQRAAETTGMRAIGVMSGLRGLENVRVPFIALMQHHFVVVYAITADKVIASDPARGILEFTHEKFKEEWSGSALLLDVTPEFHKYPTSPPIWLKYVPLLAGSTRILLEVLVASLLLYGLGLALPVFLQYFVDSILPAAKPDLFGILIVGLLGILGLQAGVGWVRRYFLVHLTARMDAMFSSLFVRKLLELPLHFFSVRTVGDITRRMQEIQNIRQVVLDESLNVVTLIVGGAINLVVLALYSPILALVLALSLAGAALWVASFAPGLVKKLRELMKAESDWQTRSWEQFDGLASIKALDAMIAARWKWSVELFATLHIRKQLGFLEGLSMSVSQLLDHGIRAIALVTAIYLFSRGQLTAGHVLATSLLAGVVVSSAITVLDSWHKFNELGVSLARVDDVITAAPEDPGTPAQTPVQLAGRVELKNVTFQYGSELSPIVLDGLSFSVEPNETVAIVGKSGSGKTTLGYMFNLLYAPAAGKILFDGVDSKELPLSAIRRNVAMIVQDNSIFSGSILENIALGDAHPSFADVVAAAQLADAHEFITSLPNGYSTVLGELGEGLSGGQRQRINIARALYRRPAILVMDEATSALDAISESKILRNLKSRRGTTIVIAHRLNTVMLADRIIVLDQGRALESGTHNELMAKHGAYHRLFAKQLAL